MTSVSIKEGHAKMVAELEPGVHDLRNTKDCSQRPEAGGEAGNGSSLEPRGISPANTLVLDF